MKKLLLLTTLVLGSLLVRGAEVVVCDGYKAEFYPQDNDWFVTLQSADGQYKAEFDIVTPALEEHKVYTLDNMFKDYTCLTTSNPYHKTAAKQASYEQWHDENGLLHVDATMTLSNGDSYQFSYSDPRCEIDPEKTAIQLNPTHVSLTDYTQGAGMWQMIGRLDDGTEVSICHYSREIIGEYTQESAYEKFCYLQTKNADGTAKKRFFCDQKTEVSMVMDADIYSLHTVAITSEGEQVEIDMLYDPLACDEVHEVEMKAINLDVVDNIAEYGSVIISAHNGEYEALLWVNTDMPTGHWYGQDLDKRYTKMKDMATRAQHAVVDCELECEADETQEGKFIVTGWIRDDNCTRYTVHLCYDKQTPTREVTYEIEGVDLIDQRDQLERWRAEAYTDDMRHHVTLVVNARQWEGQFTSGDFDIFETFIADVEETDRYLATEFYNFIEASMTTSIQDSILTIDCDMLTEGVVNPNDLVLYHLHLTGPIPDCLRFDSHENIEAELPNTRLGTDYVEYNQVQLMADNEETRMQLFMLFYIEAPDEQTVLPAGTYTINDSGEPWTVHACPGGNEDEIPASVVGIISGLGEIEMPVWMLRQGEVHVEYIDGQLHVEIDAYTSCDAHVLLHCGAKKSDGIGEITTSVHPEKRLQDGHLVIRLNGRDYDVVGQRQN